MLSSWLGCRAFMVHIIFRKWKNLSYPGAQTIDQDRSGTAPARLDIPSPEITHCQNLG